MSFKKYLSLLVIIIFLAHFVNAQDISVEIQPEFRSEIKALVLKPKIINAFNKILALEEETETEHIQLNEVAAPPFKEMERAILFQQMINAIGVDSSWIDEVGNVMALRKGKSSARTVCLDAHLDTVFPDRCLWL